MFDQTTESMKYGELFMGFPKRYGFLVTKQKKHHNTENIGRKIDDEMSV